MVMKRIRLAVLISLLLTAMAGAGYDQWQRYVAIQTSNAQYQRQYQAFIERQAKENQRPRKDKVLNEEIAGTSYPRPSSEWLANEKAFYQKLLSAGRFDVLVVPFQVQDYAFDRATRSLMTAELTLALSLTQKIQVPDPYLVARALGDGERRITAADAYRLADKVGAKRIVWGYVGHDRKGKMALTIQSQERSPEGVLNEQTPKSTKNYENVAFSDENPAIDVYQTLLPGVMKELGIEDTLLAANKSAHAFDTDKFPVDPKSLIFDQSDPARDAYAFQMLASLTPKYGERTRERLAEKSMLALLQLSDTSPQYRLLKARSYMLLGLRPAALKVLGQPQSMEEKELFHALNGNLPDVATAASQLKGVSNFLAKLDANAIGVAYGVITQKQSEEGAKKLKLPGRIWPFLAARAMTDGSDWAQHQNIFLKGLLDIEFPIKNVTAENMRLSAATIGDQAKVQTMMDLSVFEHVRKLLESERTKWSASMTIDRPSALDYIDLIEATATDNLMRRARLMTQMQGSPESSLQFLKRIESVYKGHPQYAFAQAAAQAAMAFQSGSADKEGLLKAAYIDAINAMFWEQGQGRVAADAWNVVANVQRHDYGDLGNFYVTDLPFHSFYPIWTAGGHAEYVLPNYQAALRNSTWDFEPVRSQKQWTIKDTEKLAALVNSIEGRFKGNPNHTLLLAEYSLNKGDISAAEGYYRTGIKEQPDYWQNYNDLGLLLFQSGEIEKASALFMSYPGFSKGSTENRVSLSNWAYGAGSLFFWTGNFAQSIPLYKISAAQNTGSNAEITSNLRMKLLQGDLIGAAGGSLYRARRYDSEHAYRDYLGIVHAMGGSQGAWSIFDILARQSEKRAIWESALVGHRMAGATEAEIISWAKQGDLRNSGSDSSNAATYLLRAGLTDRMPSNDLIAAVSEIERPVWLVQDGYRHIVRESGDGKSQFVLGPDSLDGGTLPIGVFKSGKKARAKSDLVYFLEAYRAMRSSDYASANTGLKEAADLYDLSMNTVSYMLPYYAFAAAKTGNSAEVEKTLAKFRPERQGFDYYLARAVIEGVSGKTDQSLSLLRKGLLRRIFTDGRPVFVEYEYAEICEWLYLATNDAKYKEEALDWARKNQKLQPWYAWPYAMAAKLTSNQTERQRAVSMTVYLDRDSERLATIPKREISAAVKRFGKLNPFLSRQSPTSREVDKI
jgi:tetratricopeptide (TPR) repeat protein